MSLIDEALKRARMEAAQKAAEGEGLPYPTIPRHLGPPRRRAWLGPLIVALAVIAGLLVGAMIATRGGSGTERTAALEPGAPIAATPAASEPAGLAPAAADRPAETPRVDPPASVPPAAAAPPRAQEPAGEGAGAAVPRAEPVTSGPARREELRRDPIAAQPPSPEPREARPPARAAEPATTPPIAPSQVASAPSPAASPPAVVAEQPAAAAIEPTPAPPAPARRAPTTAGTVTDPDSGVLLVLPDRPEHEAAAPGSAESFVQQVTLPGGGAIELGGIAWSETGPFALINGRVVGPGAVIEGFTVERIRPGHVVLSGDGRRIQLSLQ